MQLLLIIICFIPHVHNVMYVVQLKMTICVNNRVPLAVFSHLLYLVLMFR